MNLLSTEGGREHVQMVKTDVVCFWLLSMPMLERAVQIQDKISKCLEYISLGYVPTHLTQALQKASEISRALLV